jgi:uncharacterized lipoprotein YajG
MRYLAILASFTLLTGCATKKGNSVDFLEEIKVATTGAQDKSNKIQANTNNLQKTLQEAYVIHRDMTKLIEKAKSE